MPNANKATKQARKINNPKQQQSEHDVLDLAKNHFPKTTVAGLPVLFLDQYMDQPRC